MPPQSKLPDVPTLLRLLDQVDDETGKKMTRSKIARLYGVTPQAVSVKLTGVIERQLYRRDWPWEVQTRHKSRWLYNVLTYYQITRRKERVLSEAERQSLVRFLNYLEELGRDMDVDLVVDYDPESAAGFYVRERRSSDDPETIFGH